MLKRILLFGLTNILVMVTISIALSMLGVGRYLTAAGLDYTQLAIFCLVWGMAGSFISLLMSRFMAKMAMGVQVIDPDAATGEERELLNMVYGLARKAGLTTMPEVGIYDSPELNAFATGPTKSRALVAVSTGLLHSMSRTEIEGVIGHEIAHVANGDMVTLTLIQGVVNAFVMFIARILAFALSQMVEEERRPMVRYLTTFVFEIVLGLLGTMVVAAFSRWREFRADAGSATIGGRNKMIAALQALRRTHDRVDTESAPSLAAFKISSRPSGLLALFSTHPPLEERIARLQQANGMGGLR